MTDKKDCCERVDAPFNDDQVASLNAYQKSGMYHPFTCGNDHCPGNGRHSLSARILEADRFGWHCPSCSYLQSWAHSFMADWSWDISATDKQRRDREKSALSNIVQNKSDDRFLCHQDIHTSIKADAMLEAYRDADEWGKKFGDYMIPGFVRARIAQLEREKKE